MTTCTLYDECQNTRSGLNAGARSWIHFQCPCFYTRFFATFATDCVDKSSDFLLMQSVTESPCTFAVFKRLPLPRSSLPPPPPPPPPGPPFPPLQRPGRLATRENFGIFPLKCKVRGCFFDFCWRSTDIMCQLNNLTSLLTPVQWRKRMQKPNSHASVSTGVACTSQVFGGGGKWSSVEDESQKRYNRQITELLDGWIQQQSAFKLVRSIATEESLQQHLPATL